MTGPRGAFTEKGVEAAFTLKINAASYEQNSGLLVIRFAYFFDRTAGQAESRPYGLYQQNLKTDDVNYKETFIGFPSVHH
ncbi:hypothetical protein [Candidatus Williamhamiltonella defendens]|uniref:hypothetical protein n=1 Tax=Candidatus Williamhamiltonella defendens TaxID=138072 RepID=UPI00130EC159|nr:hypothetical protein [Candidatus Hamiltonella defensa]